MRWILAAVVIGLVVLFVWYLMIRRGYCAQIEPTGWKLATLWSNSFETQTWSNQWHVTKDEWGNNLRSLRSDPTMPHFLRVTYPKGSSSPASNRNYKTPIGGTEWYANMYLAPSSVRHLRYYLRFGSNFSFNKGGKLPGLYGGTCVSGGCIPDGTNGFSTRYMWRTAGAGEVYAYLPSDTGYGTSLGRGKWLFRVNQWYCIEQRVALNTPGKDDGYVTVWLDGKPVLNATNLTFRTVDALQIDGILFSTFFGGDDPSWSSKTDTYVDFAKFAVSDNYIGL